MNKKRLRALAKHLEQMPETFKGKNEWEPFDWPLRIRDMEKIWTSDPNIKSVFLMKTWGMYHQKEKTFCGCIAGHTVFHLGREAFGPRLEHWSGTYGVEELARYILELTLKEGNALFVPFDTDLGDISAEEAADACRRLAAGEPLDKLWGYLPIQKETENGHQATV